MFGNGAIARIEKFLSAGDYGSPLRGGPVHDFKNALIADRSTNQRDLRPVEVTIDVGRHLERRFTVGGRVDVPSARQQQAVDTPDRFRDLLRLQSIRLRGDDDGLSACGLHGAEIGQVVRVAA